MRDPAKLAGALLLLAAGVIGSQVNGCTTTPRAAIKIVPDSDGLDSGWQPVTLPATWSLDAGPGGT
jgi:hypothetical protein